MITPLVGAIDMKPGSATLPFFGIKPSIVDKDNQEVEGPGEGSLCIDISWPGQMRSVYGDHERFIDTYFKQYPGRYFLEMVVEEMMMVIIGLLEEWMM
jgi:acetyl-CoA synthetase